MSITLHAGTTSTGTAGTTRGTAGTASTATDGDGNGRGSGSDSGNGSGRRLAPEHLATVDATQRAHLSFALSPDAPDGEHLVRRAVELLAPYGWHHLRMVTWRQATPGTVAHLVVGPGGVVVIDERIWTGPVYVEAGLLRHNGFPCDREIAALGDAVAALAALLPPQHRTAVAGVICVTPRDMPAQTVGGVTLVGRLHLGGLLAGLEERLSLAEIHEVARALAFAFDGQAPTPGTWPEVPTQRPSPEGRHLSAPAATTSAYFARPQSTQTPAAGSPGTTGSPGTSGTTGATGTDGTAGTGNVWRAAIARVAVAALVAFLTYQNSEAITVAVDEWLGGDVTAVVAAEG